MYKLTDIYKQIKEEELASQKSQYKIFCDMDGVLCDFDRRFKQFAQTSSDKYETKFGTEKFWELIDQQVGYMFWSEMPWMKDGQQLWNYIKQYNPILLSAPSNDKSSRYGKRLWAEKHTPGAKLILAKRENKQDYSGKNRILIDDRSDTIREWNLKGGIGILHTSAQNTINTLKKLGI